MPRAVVRVEPRDNQDAGRRRALQCHATHDHDNNMDDVPLLRDRLREWHALPTRESGYNVITPRPSGDYPTVRLSLSLTPRMLVPKSTTLAHKPDFRSIYAI